MSPPRDWRELLEDMIEYLELANGFTHDVALAEFSRNSEKYLAVSRALEIAGEAAKQVPATVRDRYPGVEWKNIVGFRDVLAHAYLSLKPEIIWDAAVRKAPATCTELRRILASEPRP
jgi:uncharacterized protein with HEPN domain